MKLLAFTDMHGSLPAFQEIKKKAKQADLIVCCGDFTIFERNMEAVLKAINSLGQVLLIHGNHEYSGKIELLIKKFKNIKFLHKRCVVANDILFLGYGGGGFGIKDAAFERWGERIEKIIKKFPDKKTVLLVHGPPYGTKVDRIMNQQCGNKSYRKFIDAHSIRYVICGHLHECSGKSDTIKGTYYLNPGPYGKVIDI